MSKPTGNIKLARKFEQEASAKSAALSSAAKLANSLENDGTDVDDLVLSRVYTALLRMSRLLQGRTISGRYEDALAEFKEHLGVDIPENMFRLLKWPTGIREKVWSHNVVSIGLSAGFIEPLESGGLYSVHEFLFKLIQVLPRASNKWNGFQREQFNHSVRKKFTSFRDFVVKHYTMGYYRSFIDSSFQFISK